MIFLKTYFYTPTEINFINLNLMESYDKIDKFIVCEANIHHTGKERDYIFGDYEHLIHPDYKDKLIYLKLDIKDKSMYADSPEKEHLIHSINEPLMRGHFVKLYNFDDNDIIISVDADEIIYNHSYDEIISEVTKHNVIKIDLNQFFYRLNYHWKNKEFIAPTAAKYKVYKNKYPSNWRYDGKLLNGKKGCHFSWCMTPEQMIFKLNTYSHPKYRKFANIEILKDAIKNKKYPFDNNIEFNIEEINIDSDIIPKSLNNNMFENIRKEFF